jgi:hypothetical protein
VPPDQAQCVEDGRRRRRVRDVDVVTDQEPPGVDRIDQVVVHRLAEPTAQADVATGPVAGVRDDQQIVGVIRRSNVHHDLRHVIIRR